MTNLERLVTTCVELGTAKTLEALGITSGELSQKRAIAVYGRWFKEAERQGRIRPCRIGNGKNGTRYYRVVDILSTKANDALKAELI